MGPPEVCMYYIGQFWEYFKQRWWIVISGAIWWETRGLETAWKRWVCTQTVPLPSCVEETIYGSHEANAYTPLPWCHSLSCERARVPRPDVPVMASSPCLTKPNKHWHPVLRLVADARVLCNDSWQRRLTLGGHQCDCFNSFCSFVSLLPESHLIPRREVESFPASLK